MRLLRRVLASLDLPTPEPEQLIRRIIMMEREIILPLKVAGIMMLLYSFYFRPWIGRVLSELEIAVELTQYFLWFYIAANLLFTVALFNIRRLPLALVQWLVFATGLLDGMFLASLTLVTGGYQSFLYWLFLGLIIRGSVSVPRVTSQLALNLTVIACYVMAGIINIYIAKSLEEQARAQASMQPRALRQAAAAGAVPTNQIVAAAQPPHTPAAVTPDEAAEALALAGPEGAAEPLLVRLALLLLMTVCAFGVQVLLERQRMTAEEAREFTLRDAQLRSADRLAAEFAHQIKNPLAIINTAAFSLQRALETGRGDAAAKVKMIQEEVGRADRIITEVMGYAQLVEGHIEKLNLVEELDSAIARVFPPASSLRVLLHKEFQPALPPLFIQKRHATEIFTNVLLNAREALGDRGGNVWVTARYQPDSGIEIAIADDGPGVPPDKQERVFEAYYTTKPKGSGLGLPTVKNAIELYGGSVRLESGLGKGARFVLVFPAKTFMHLSKLI